MPVKSAEEKAERKLALLRKRQEKENMKKKQMERISSSVKQTVAVSVTCHSTVSRAMETTVDGVPAMRIPEVALNKIFAYLSARDLGCAILTCQVWNYTLTETRISYVRERLKKQTKMCSTLNDARSIVEDSYRGGDTKRLVSRKQRQSEGRGDCDEFIGYARFLEEAVCGYSHLKVGNNQDQIFLPGCVNGRFASVSPEHSLTRIGGDGIKSGPGGSGVAAWGVGRRGQLGLGNREDVAHPTRLFGNLGYGIRIVQVAAGGGLVRVAHSLFLTDTGRVLSCGNGSYGQLGHGYSGAKQLPDYIKPTFISFFNGMHITCISAGEIHSAAVNSDGDLFTFGDGFLGMLGHADKRPQVIPKQVQEGGLEDECVLSVACGCRHTLIITEEGEVWSMGFGRYGVLGRSFTPYEHEPAAINLAGGDLENDHAFEGNQPDAVLSEEASREQREQFSLQEHLDLLNKTLDDTSDQCIPKVIDSLKGIKITGASAGHRHSILLDNHGGVYTFGSGVTGALGHGDNIPQMYPMKVMEFVNENVRIMQISAGVDMSMAVSNEGKVYSWGKSDGGRIGLGNVSGIVNIPRQVQISDPHTGRQIKAVDVECGYVHALIIGLDGTLHQCGGVGINGADDGQQEENFEGKQGVPIQLKDLNIWHRLVEPKEAVKVPEKWKKYGKYEVSGRSKMLGLSK